MPSEGSRRSDRLHPGISPSTLPLDNPNTVTFQQPPIQSPMEEPYPEDVALPKDETVEESDDELDLKTLLRLMVKNELRRSQSPSTPPSTTVISSSKDANARAPDTFNGTDPSQLNRFIRSCKVYFLNNASRFRTDRSKVLYSGSYLTGLAGDWFEPYTDNTGEHEVMLDSWSSFEDSLREMFGDSNLKETAEFKLDTMVMKYTDQISTYIITKFRTYSKQLDWDDAGKRYLFKKGLPARILDRTAEMEFPDTLEGIMSAAKKVDDRHWQREREKKLLSRATVTEGNFSKSSNPKRSSSRHDGTANKTEHQSSNQSKHNRNATTKPKSSSNFDRSSKPSSTNKNNKDLDKLLNKEGKLTSAEKARRAERGLCGYCGGSHSIDHCPIKPQASSGRYAASVGDSSASTSVVEQGN